MSQVTKVPIRKDALLNSLPVNKNRFVKVGGCLGHRDHEVLESKIVSVMRKRDKKSCYPRLHERES